MSVELIVTVSLDVNLRETGREVTLDAWTSFVQQSEDLRLRGDAHTARDPASGMRISMAPLDGETELRVGSRWCPFLWHRRGELHMRYNPAMERPDDPVRSRVAQIARHFGAVILTDAGDELLDW